ncbi:hypothetical protein MTO96_018138 [Rhipicephalus appendiculatus]
MQACGRQQMLPNKTRRRSKSGRRRGSKKDDPFAATAPDDAEGVSPTLRERDMESAFTIDLGAGVPFQGGHIGKQQPPPPHAQRAPDQPASIMAPKREKKRHHRRRRKESRTSMVDEGTETTAAPVPTEALSSGTAAGTSGAGAVPKRKGVTATGQVSPRMAVVTSGPVLQDATASAGSLLGGTQQPAPAPRPPAMATSLGSSTAAQTAQYPPECLPGIPTTAAQQVPGPGPVADFGKTAPSGSEQQATTTRTATVAASVPPPVPLARDIPQKIDEACAVLRELAMQQPSAEPSTSTAGGTNRTAARQSGAFGQRSPTLARMTAKLAQRSNTQMTQDDDEQSASEDEEAIFPSTRKVDRRASKIHRKNQSAQQYRLATQFPETHAHAQGQLNATAGSPHRSSRLSRAITWT